MKEIDITVFGDAVSGGVLIAGDATYFADRRRDFSDEYSDWADAVERMNDISTTQSLNANLTDGMAYVYLLDMDLAVDTDNDGQTDSIYYGNDMYSGVDADNNGQIDALENSGILAQDSVIY